MDMEIESGYMDMEIANGQRYANGYRDCQWTGTPLMDTETASGHRHC